MTRHCDKNVFDNSFRFRSERGSFFCIILILFDESSRFRRYVIDRSRYVIAEFF